MNRFSIGVSAGRTQVAQVAARLQHTLRTQRRRGVLAAERVRARWVHRPGRTSQAQRETHSDESLVEAEKNHEASDAGASARGQTRSVARGCERYGQIVASAAFLNKFMQLRRNNHPFAQCVGGLLKTSTGRCAESCETFETSRCCGRRAVRASHTLSFQRGSASDACRVSSRSRRYWWWVGAQP